MNQEHDDFWAEVARLLPPMPTVELEYRLHYADTGAIVSCTMTDHPESTQYIVVDRATYERYFEYSVYLGRLVKITHDAGYRRSLTKSVKGFPVVPGHANLLLEENDNVKDVEYYARNN